MKQTISVLALLGVLNIKQTYASNSLQNQKQQTEAVASNLINELSETELDLSEFLTQVTSSPQNENKEEDHDEEQEEDHEDNTQNISQKKQKRSNGRDANGMYKNHQNFVKLRNQINQQENSHSAMFESINAKLTDRAFIEKASHVETKTETKSLAEKQPPNKDTANYIMNDEDQICYAKRYSDVKDSKSSSVHFSMVGKFEGRNPKCAPELTQIMARRYAYRYPDIIANSNYQNYAVLAKNANEHWQTKGFKQQRDSGLYIPAEEPQRCADQGGICSCNGRVFYGLAKRIDNKKNIEQFQDMLEFAVKSKWAGKSKIVNCNDDQFGVSETSAAGKVQLFQGQQKQCFCEPRLASQAFHSAEEGQKLQCPKDQYVFFGQKLNSQGKLSSAEEMIRNSFTVKIMGADKDSKCNAEFFDGVDPLPGAEKHCYCDWQPQKLITKESFTNIQSFWQAKKTEKQARDQLKQGEINAETAKITTDKEAASIKADVDKRMALNEKTRQESDQKAAAQRTEADKKANEQINTIKTKKTQMEKVAEGKITEGEKMKKESESKNKQAEETLSKLSLEKNETQKQLLTEKAEEEKASAQKQAIAASLLVQQGTHEKSMAALLAAQELSKVESDFALLSLKLAKESEQRSIEAANEKAKYEAEQAQIASLLREKASNAEIFRSEKLQVISESISQQLAAIQARIETDKQNRQSLMKLETEKEASDLAEKERLQKEAETDLQRKEEEAKRASVAFNAQQAALKAQQQSQEDEKRRLETLIYEKVKQEQNAKDQLLKAQKTEEQSKTPQEIQNAIQISTKIQHELEEIQKEKKRTMEAKQVLEEQMSKQNQLVQTTETQTKDADEQKSLAQQKAVLWKKEAEDSKVRAAKQQTESESIFRFYSIKMEEQRLETYTLHQKAEQKLQNSIKSAQESVRLTKKSQEMAKKMRQEQLDQEKKKSEEEERLNKENSGKNVWNAGTTGVSVVTISVDNSVKGLAIEKKLFQSRLIAESSMSPIKRTVLTKANQKQSRFKLSLTTSDERVAELIEELNIMLGSNEHQDLVVTAMTSGSKEYIDWVKTQTAKNEKQNDIPRNQLMQVPQLLVENKKKEKKVEKKEEKKVGKDQNVEIDDGEESSDSEDDEHEK